LNHKFV